MAGNRLVAAPAFKTKDWAGQGETSGKRLAVRAGAVYQRRWLLRACLNLNQVILAKSIAEKAS